MNNEQFKLILMGLSPETIVTDEVRKWQLNPDMLTMIGYDRLTNLEVLIEQILKNNIEGDIIETGVWRGGACIFIEKLLQGTGRKIFVADSFKGLPKPDEKYSYDNGDRHHAIEMLSVSLDLVKQNFLKHTTLENVVFIEGWFKDTLKLLKNKFSIIRLDGDMYESTMDAISALYPLLTKGGYCIIDDYGCVPNCFPAVDSYRDMNNITEPMIKIDGCGVYWQKIN